MRIRTYKYGPRIQGPPIFSPEDGDLAARVWKIDRNNYAERSTTIGGVRTTLRAHRLVLSRILGRQLTNDEVCDHINGNRLDNQRENLRLTDRQGNSQNRITMTASGRRNVTWHKCGKWQASIKRNGKSFYLGLFSDPDEAARVAASKRRELGFLERGAA